jgi:hypothetical protein
MGLVPQLYAVTVPQLMGLVPQLYAVTVPQLMGLEPQLYAVTVPQLLQSAMTSHRSNLQSPVATHDHRLPATNTNTIDSCSSARPTANRLD